MKIILVHGDHTEKSYERIAKFIDVAKKRGWKIKRLDGSKSETIPEALSSNSLFKEEALFILEDASSLSKNTISWIKDNYKALDGNLVLFNEGYLPAKVLDSLPKPSKTEVYKYPSVIYKFLESFHPGNAETALKYLYALKEKSAEEYILAILSGHLRDVYIALLDVDKLKYPSWRTSKLKKQAGKFSQAKLKNLISLLSETDYNSKTSSDSIYSSLDLIIATKLE